VAEPEAEVLEVPDVLEPDRLDSSVPVISTFSFTCLLSSLSCPSRTYRLPLEALDDVPDVPLVLAPLVLLLLELPLPIWALVRMYSPDDELLDVLGVVVVVDVEPVVPVVLLLPFWRQPVRVIVPLEL